MATGRIEAAITSLSWIPPEQLDDHAALIAADRCRFVNHLTAWIDVDDGRIVASGRGGGGFIGSTAMKLGARLTFGGVPFPDLHPEPEVGDGLHADGRVLLLDGVVVVAVDGIEMVELGPGAVLGERAVLEGGLPTSTVTARTACRVATADAAHIDPDALAELSLDHRREYNL